LGEVAELFASSFFVLVRVEIVGNKTPILRLIFFLHILGGIPIGEGILDGVELLCDFVVEVEVM